MNSILVFGAGKIGRSFIGQIFALSGYEVIFCDIDPVIVGLLNERKSYPVVIKNDEKETTINVPVAKAILATNEKEIIEAVSKTTLIATSVGKNALSAIVPLIAKGVLHHGRPDVSLPLDIIIAENMLSAGEFLRAELMKHLPATFPFDTIIGLVETSIGKMVPIMSQEETAKDPLMVFAEPYNELIVDGKGFKGGIPHVKWLAPKDNIKAWVERKAFIHNLGHATAAYYGAFRHSKAVYLYEALQDNEVLSFTRKTMHQAALVLNRLYPEELTLPGLKAHIDDLLQRFQNRALKDTIFRVGQDLPRKLGPDDRFMGIIRLAINLKMDYSQILKAMAFAFVFKGYDEKGNRSARDLVFERQMKKGIDNILTNICGLDMARDEAFICELRKEVEDITHSQPA